MGLAEWFSRFCANLVIQNDDVISTRRRAITRRLDADFWATGADDAHGLSVGSYGRGTAIQGLRNVNLLFVLPPELYGRYDSGAGNGKHALLQDARASIGQIHSRVAIKADGQAIVVPFDDGMSFDVVPGFRNKDGSYTYPGAKAGGSWKRTNPISEIEAIREKNLARNHNLIPLCRMMRAWRDQWAVPISGYLIDALAYEFIEGYVNRDKSYLYYDFMCRDFFSWMSGQHTEREYWRAPGSGQYVYGKGLFQSEAKRCHELSLTAIAHDAARPKRECSAKRMWGEIFGPSFPS